ncbi:MAG: hypothetical protein NPIRA05_18490 [Nitrospirales bacterium]|nr:MAG: hypothetical protein NPIRA05_18490 [Nitrospirales bacterium]
MEYAMILRIYGTGSQELPLQGFTPLKQRRGSKVDAVLLPSDLLRKSSNILLIYIDLHTA